jgi:transposase
VISIGVDAHKRMHVASALDAHGRELGSWRGPNSARGWDSFSQWLESLGDERRVGIEGAWSYGRQLAQRLVERGERVHEVNTRWTAAGRLRARRIDKSDRLDARAVAAFIHREGDSLSTIAAEDQTTVLDLLTSEREATLAEATRLRNQIHALLLQLDPEYKRSIPSLTSKSALATLRSYRGTTEIAMSEERAAAVQRLTARLELALQQAEDIAKRIRSIAEAHFAPSRRSAA